MLTICTCSFSALKTGWWWRNGHFTLLDFFSLIFYREGDFVLGEYGQSTQNGYTLVDAFGEGASRAYYGWCLGEGSSLCGTPGSVASYLNWSVRYSQSVTNTLTAINKKGSTLVSQFYENYYRGGITPIPTDNAAKVAYAFFNPDAAWQVQASQSAGRPYGWGNDLDGVWLPDNKGIPSMVIWSFFSFYIPTYEGWRQAP